MMQEVGRLLFTSEDAARLKDYLLKGGFLWVDDFGGSYAWDVWAGQIRKVFPPDEYPIVDLPMDHPIFHTMFDLRRVPQIPGIGTRLGSGRTSERVSDSWEREGEDPEYFFKFSVEGYKVAVNVLLYTMTH